MSRDEDGSRRDIASGGDRANLLIQAMADVGLDWKVEEAGPVIEKIKTNFGKVEMDSPEGMLCRAYQEALERNGKIDFQDMLRLAVEGMQTGSIKPYPVKYLLVDEFQDTDAPVRGPARAGRHRRDRRWRCDQSIYGFRAALGFLGMETFIRQFAASPVVLGMNYRCNAEILAGADMVIRNICGPHSEGAGRSEGTWW